MPDSVNNSHMVISGSLQQMVHMDADSAGFGPVRRILGPEQRSKLTHLPRRPERL